MINKALSCFLITALVFSCCAITASAQSPFPDLGSGHWAYEYVMTLVADGTVKGFEDGEFKPEQTVSRAEFVKMIGKGTQKRNSDFADVPPSHWAYEYVISAELEANGSLFEPDTAITRNDCMNLIWKRNGSSADAVAPSIITKQGTNKSAVAWSYTYGIMIGDDGLNLRLDSPLSRAEAAALIIRARSVGPDTKKNNFIDTVSENILETVFNSIDIFEGAAYDSGKTISNGEMARAALMLGFETPNITYRAMPDTLFDGKYSKELYTVCKEVLGEGRYSAEFAQKPATVQDAFAAFAYNAIRKSRSPVRYGSKGNYYPDITKADSSMTDICLTYCFENGVLFNAGNNISPEKAITHKELACLLLQLDELIGLHTEFTTDKKNDVNVSINSKIRKNVSSYPANFADYAFVLEGVPNQVYLTPFAQSKERAPKQVYAFAKEYKDIFINMLTELKNKIEGAKNASLRFTFYPSLVCDNGNGATIRVKCEVLKNDSNASFEQIFGSGISEETDAPAGLTFYADVITGQELNDVYIPLDNVEFKQIVCFEK